jgi:hypothetical protein
MKIQKKELKNQKNSNMYYIRNEGYLGNALIWWARGRNGYTCDIDNAHKFTKEEAERICERHQDTAYKCEYIDGLDSAKKTIIDSQYVDEEERMFN